MRLRPRPHTTPPTQHLPPQRKEARRKGQKQSSGSGLRRTLALSSGAVTIMVVVGFVVPLALTLRTVAYDQATNAAGLEARSIAEVLLTDPGPQVAASVVDQANASSARRVELVLPSGASVGVRLPGGADLTQAKAGASITVKTGGGAIVDVPVHSVAGTTVVRVMVPPAQASQGVGQAWLLLLLLGLGLVMLAMIVGDRMARSITRPVAQLEGVATTLSHGHLNVRAEVEGPKEIQSVAVAVNDLGTRITYLLQAEREAAADLSHRLRTPLTALRLHIESISEPELRDRLIADSDSIAAAVDEIIRAVRSSSAPPEGCDLAATVGSRMRFWGVLADAQHRPVRLSIPAHRVPIGVPAPDLEAVVDALVTNVLSHTPEPTGFEVRVLDDGPTCRLLIEDRGPGLDARLLARGRSGTGGTGLGLDIARRTAERGGGSIEIRRRNEGGASIRLTFPKARWTPRPALVTPSAAPAPALTPAAAPDPAPAPDQDLALAAAPAPAAAPDLIPIPADPAPAPTDPAGALPG